MSPSLHTRENRELAVELKFVLGAELASQVLDWSRGRLAPDPYCTGRSGEAYPITTLYFDTERFDVFHRRASYGRSKYRIRRYGAGEVVFLERKLKTQGLVTKRRSVVHRDELTRLTNSEPDDGWAGFWFQRRVLRRRLGPVCQISYQRIARVAMTPYGPIRLTLDQNLSASKVDRPQFVTAEMIPILESAAVLELKFLGVMPVVFKCLVEEFALNPQRFSKYRQAVTALDLCAASAEEVCEPLATQYA